MAINKSDKECYAEFAKKLYASYISERLGITLSYADKAYTKNINLGDIWFLFAKNIDEIMNDCLQREISSHNSNMDDFE